MFDWSISKTISNPMIVPDDSPPVDSVLESTIVDKVYARWDTGKYGVPIDYGGGVRAITAKMVYDAGDDFIMSLPGIGTKRTAEILSKLKGVIAEVPYQ